MAENSVTRVFESKPEVLEPIRDFVTEIGKKAGIDRKKSYGLSLAIDEIATNIIKYGYTEQNKQGVIYVTVETGQDKLTVILEDDSAPFNPLLHIHPDETVLAKPLEERTIGGLGIMIAKKSVDAFDYEFINERNRNIFCVNL